ncbi:hypothetical protein [Phosphitispora fastidiosa]|uniref:hypothetical protein n=1 Tax=Phosphitispora fastidiosa TaxID=2837202 RepID=UPI001E2D77AB|nr:hypothetical protein [Phosphitispora fastidiosa]MBU7006343.1 hypothetical protein [Phosphitispora fastidiosa]
MGWNQGYTIMEQQVVALHDAGILTKEVLNALMEPFRDTDIDHGGCYDLKSKDGKTADEIIVFIMEPEKYQKAVESFIPENLNDPYNKKLDDLWCEITRREWSFW